MQIACPSCRKAFVIDDARLPRQAVTMKCPSCGGAISVVPPSSPPAPPALAPAPAAPAVRRPGEEATPPAPLPLPDSQAWERLRREVAAEVLHQLGVKGSVQGDEEDEGLGEEGRKVALICEDEALFQVTITETLEKIGYRVDVAPSRDAAVDLLGRNSYALVTVDNRLPDDPEGGYKILQAINGLPPEQRRKMFVAFISADLSTMDTNSAFILGANLTVGKKDVRRLDKILTEGLKDHRRIYHTFFQVADELQQQDL